VFVNLQTRCSFLAIWNLWYKYIYIHFLLQSSIEKSAPYIHSVDFLAKMCCHGQNQLNGHRLCFWGKCLLINPSLTAQILVQPASPFDCPTNHSPCILSDKPICSKWVSYPEATILIHVLFVISSSYLVFMDVSQCPLIMPFGVFIILRSKRILNSKD
jgi:hypothetical protein